MPEKIWHLPRTRLCFTPPPFDVPVGPPPALKHGYIIFGCFSNLSRLGDEVVALWCQVLWEPAVSAQPEVSTDL